MREWVVFFCVGILLFVSVSANADNVVIQSSKCTYLDWDEPDDNYGAINTLYVHRNTPADDRVSLFQFNLNSIPENAVITSATLSLCYYDDHFLGPTEHLGVAIYPLLVDWTEGNNGARAGASWTYRHASPDGRTWDNDGARGATTEVTWMHCSIWSEMIMAGRTGSTRNLLIASLRGMQTPLPTTAG